MNYKNLSWAEALKESHKTLLSTHPRSPKKLVYPHQWIKERIKMNLGDNYEYYAVGETKSIFDKEYTVCGSFYDKKTDITIVKDNKVKGAISFKFVASNYSQNSNNYFENLIGECYNIQSRNVPFCHVFVIRDNIPYYDKNHNVKKNETITQHNLDKYLKLNRTVDKASPSKLSISIIHISGDKYNNNIIHTLVFGKLSEFEQQEILKNINVSINDNTEYPSYITEELKNMEVNKVLKEFSHCID